MIRLKICFLFSYFFSLFKRLWNMSGESLRENLLLGMGNPLLDITATADADFLKKYDLKADNAILAEKQHMPMYKEMIEKYDVEYTAGGACLNTMRVAQWILQKPKIAAFMGCIGKDKFGEILEERAAEAGVNAFFQYSDKHPAGTCAVLLTNNGVDRSLCANLSAADKFTKDHIDIPENRAVVENAGFYYFSGFFLIVSPESVMDVAKHAAKHNKPFCLNLSAVYISQVYTGHLMSALPYVDILIGNKHEAIGYAHIVGWETRIISEIALKMCDITKENKARSRMVIITRECESIIVARDGKIQEFPAVEVRSEEIVDTNSAGDAFAGGFIAMYIQGKPLEQCVKCGIYAATEVIKRSGCSFPEKPNFP